MGLAERALGPKTVIARIGLIALVQQACFLLVEYFSAHWPGSKALEEKLAQSNLVIAWSPVALVYAIALATIVVLPEALTLRKRAAAVKHMEEIKLGCLFTPPSVIALGAFSLLLWWSDLYGDSLIVQATGEDPGMLLAIGLTFGSLVWGTVILLIGLVARAVVLRVVQE